MTPDNVFFLAVGCVMNGLVFAIGVAVGISLRKDSEYDDRDNDTTEAKPGGSWHLDLDIGTPHSPQLRSSGGAHAKPEADPDKRAPL